MNTRSASCRVGFVFYLAGMFTVLLFTPALAQQPPVKLSKEMYLDRLAPNVWRHVSSSEVNGFGLVEANGLIIQAGREVLLVDTPWNDEKTGQLLDWIGKELRARVTLAVFTHSHGDRQGGIKELHKRGIRTISSARTVAEAKAQGLDVSKESFEESYEVKLGGQKIRLWYPGPGHTRDNIVVWVPRERILFGGCLVKAANETSLGYVKEADLPQWPRTMENLLKTYPQMKTVIPGHGDPSDVKAIMNTIDLLKKAETKQ